MRALLMLLVLALAPLAGCLEAAVPQQDAATGEPLARPVLEMGWPDLETATIRPGVLVESSTRTCASNFLFARPDNESLFLGIAAHCVREMRVGELVLIDPGRTDAEGLIIYHSWQTMEELGITDTDAWLYNDFAVLRIQPSVRELVHPALVRYGGPAAVGDPDALALGDRLVSYGEAAPGQADLGARHMLVASQDSDWGLLTYGAPPGIPGQMGTAVTTPDGAAVGVLVSLGVYPDPATNGVARLDKLMAFAHEHANLYMDLVTWEQIEPFDPLPAADLPFP